MRAISEQAIIKLIGDHSSGHCDSCHDDEAHGYDDMIYMEFGKGRYSYVCCRVSNDFDEWCKSKK